MEYFTHEFNGTIYEFKPNRRSQAEISKLQAEARKAITPEAMKSLPKKYKEIDKVQKELDELNKKLDECKTEEEKEKYRDEVDTLTEKANNLYVEIMPISDAMQSNNTSERALFILLKCQKNIDGTDRYNIDEDKFQLLLDDISEKYGIDEYNEIVEAIAEDVFTMSGKEKKAEPQSNFLKNRKR